MTLHLSKTQSEQLTVEIYKTATQEPGKCAFAEKFVVLLLPSAALHFRWTAAMKANFIASVIIFHCTVALKFFVSTI